MSAATVNALRIRLRLSEPIPQLPELDSMIGKTVEIIVLAESDTVTSPPPSDFWQSPTLDEVIAKQGPKPTKSFEEFKGGWPEDQLNDGFEEAVDELRREPWMRGEG